MDTTDDTERVFDVAKIWVHPNYNPSTINNDFAVLRLTESIDFSLTWAIQRICLPTSCSDGCDDNDPASTAGWGVTSDGGTTASRYLRATNVNILPSSTCSSQYDSFTDKMLCAGVSGGGQDTCNGDSGGPLVTNDDGFYKICGVTSFGYVCGSPNSYGVYS